MTAGGPSIPGGDSGMKSNVVRPESSELAQLMDTRPAEPFIVMREGHCLGDQVLRFCERREVRAKISFRSAQLETIQALVTAGLGMSLVPAMAVRRTGGSPPAYRSVVPARPERVITALWPKARGLSRAAGALLGLMAGQGAPA